MNYLFDVDGTLTDSRKKIDPQFRSYFAEWVNYQRMNLNSVYLVTGSDRDKTVEQIGISLWRHVDGVYQNSGNVYYEHGKIIRQKIWKIPKKLRLSITRQIKKSEWFGKASHNIEERIGMLNISTVGRSASPILRKEYFEWDSVNGERAKIVHELSREFPDIDFSIGGEISIDIYPKGSDKSQVLKDMLGESTFFGDRCEVGGNDFTISTMCESHFKVNGWKETYEILTKLL